MWSLGGFLLQATHTADFALQRSSWFSLFCLLPTPKTCFSPTCRFVVGNHSLNLHIEDFRGIYPQQDMLLLSKFPQAGLPTTPTVVARLGKEEAMGPGHLLPPHLLYCSGCVFNIYAHCLCFLLPPVVPAVQTFNTQTSLPSQTCQP